MIEFGATLRAAREAKGYTIAQIAESTHMAPSTVEDLEKEDFSRIAAPIYGRGFVKLYCEAVGLDAKQLVAEFMDIYNGNRDTSIKERPCKVSVDPEPEQQTSPEPADTKEDLPVATPTPAPTLEQDLFAPTAPEPAEQPCEPPPQPTTLRPMTTMPADDLFAPQPQPAEPPRLSRYAAPVSQSQIHDTMPKLLSPAIWRIAALVCVAIVLAWLGFMGIRALYRATNTPIATPPDTVSPPAATTAEEKPQPSKPKDANTATVSPRDPQNIPALYID